MVFVAVYSPTVYGRPKWAIPYQTKGGPKRCYFAKFRDCKASKNPTDYIKNTAVIFANSRNTFENRLKAKCCELCGTTESDHYEIHHVHKIKDLKGKAWWEVAMIAKRRKTLVVCRECHYKIHNRVLNDQATMESRIP